MIKRWIFPLVVLYPLSSFAGGFYLQEQSTRYLGSVFAGAGALADEASTVYYNPAGMMRVPHQVQADVQLVTPKSQLKNQGSLATTTGTGGSPLALAGNNPKNPYTPTVIGSFFFVSQPFFDGKSTFGLGISTPFGLANEYGRTSFNRYDSLKSSLSTYDVQPTLAYQLSPQWMIGVGANIQKLDIHLANAIPSPATVGGPVVSTDGFQDLKGSSLALGFTTGVLYAPTDKARVGLTYRSAVTHHIDGTAQITNPLDIPGIGGNYSRLGATSSLTLPSVTTVSAEYEVSPTWQIFGHTSRFSWSNFDRIEVLTSDGTTSVTPTEYRDTVNFALGLSHKFSEDWSMRAGYQFDPTPTQTSYRSSRVPDSDREWFGLGLEHLIGPETTINASFSYLKFQKNNMTLRSSFTTGTIDTNSAIDSNVKLFSIGLTRRF